MKDINKTSVRRLAEALAKKELSSVELTREYIKEISSDPQINSFISVCATSALYQAEQADKRRAEGRAIGALDGIPYAVKDNICTSGISTTCGSRYLQDFVPPYSATAVQRLEAAGCVMLGKTNMDEFAMGTRSDTSIYGAVKNPHDPCRTAGGSSGGSAAAVAAGQVAFALGSDTGGSARLPAAYCGGVAIKPTYGTVSRYGLVAFSSSLEQICPMTADVYSNALVLRQIMGADPYDATSTDRAPFDMVEIEGGVKGLRIGIDTAAVGLCHKSVQEVFFKTVERLRYLGAAVVPVSLPDTSCALAAYRIVSCAEAFSNLSRFDGIRYGRQAQGADSIDKLFVDSRSEGFGEQVKHRLLLGALALERNGGESYYQKATGMRRQIRLELDSILQDCDAILTPTATGVAPLSDNVTPDGYKEDIFCVMANLSSLPALTLNCGRNESGMPIGLQLMGQALSEAMLYRIGYALEQTEEREENDG